MRYQERIYIQNQHGGVRNRAISNVNLSSDLCVFTSPTFDVSGATKILCVDCSCPSGYTLVGTACTETIVSAATFNGIGSPVVAGDKSITYSMYGAYFYPSIENLESLPVFYTTATLALKDQTGATINATAISATNPFWSSNFNSLTNGRLNNVGISAATNEFVGFTQCVDIPTSGTYYIGIAADNYCKFKLNGKLIANFSADTAQESFKIWTVIPFNLMAGKNIIEMEGSNEFAETAFGAEIYNPSSFAALTAATTVGETGLIFSSKDKIGSTFDLGNTVGYSCPVGYALDNCSPQVSCVKITKLPCESGGEAYKTSADTGVFVVSTATTIPIIFNFTGNTDSFTENNAKFKYEVYKYSHEAGIFPIPAKYKSDSIDFSGFSGINTLIQEIPISDLQLDGDYLIKGYYEFDACTDYLKRLGKKVDTSLFKQGSAYQLYDSAHDYYFIGMSQASKPTFIADTVQSSVTGLGLFQEPIYLDLIDNTEPINEIVINGEYTGDLIITKNGYTLTNGLHYTYSGAIVTLNAVVTSADVVTAIYSKSATANLKSEVVSIGVITSGGTNAQGSSSYYYNNTEGYYELYTSITPLERTEILVVINGVTMVNGRDFSQSVSNPKRIILYGNLQTNDVINIIYYPKASVVNGIDYLSSTILWQIDSTPQLNNGQFTIEVSTSPVFSTLQYTNIVPYEADVAIYSGVVQFSGDFGDNLYYRVKNEKVYESICGFVTDVAYSDVISVTVETNSLNTY